MHADMEVAKEQNAQALSELSQWLESQKSCEMKFMEKRNQLLDGLKDRFEKQAKLKALVSDPDISDLAELQKAVTEAADAQVGIWDEELMEAGKQKSSLVEAAGSIKATIGKLDEMPLADAAARQEFGKLLVSVKDLQKQLQKKKVPFPDDLIEEAIMTQASQALQEAEAQAALAPTDVEQS